MAGLSGFFLKRGSGEFCLFFFFSEVAERYVFLTGPPILM